MLPCTQDLTSKKNWIQTFFSEVIRDNKLTGLCCVKMQSFWRNYKDGVLLAFILATGLGVLYDHGVSGQQSVVPTAGLLIITFPRVSISAKLTLLKHFFCNCPVSQNVLYLTIIFQDSAKSWQVVELGLKASNSSIPSTFASTPIPSPNYSISSEHSAPSWFGVNLWQLKPGEVSSQTCKQLKNRL